VRTLRIFIDSAELADIERYNADDAVSGFTTNATLVKRAGADVQKLVDAARKEISVEYGTCDWREHVRWKTTSFEFLSQDFLHDRWNLTAICSAQQVPAKLPENAIISVFAGRIMDTGRSPALVISHAKRTGAQVLWASSRSVYDITLAEICGCDIITLTPAIYEKYREWHGMDLEEVGRRTIAQFEADRA
jgi:transaldolase